MSFKKSDIEVLVDTLWRRKAAEWGKEGDDEAAEKWRFHMEPLFREQAKHILKAMSKKHVLSWVKQITGDDTETEHDTDQEDSESSLPLGRKERTSGAEAQPEASEAEAQPETSEAEQEAQPGSP